MATDVEILKLAAEYREKAAAFVAAKQAVAAADEAAGRAGRAYDQAKADIDDARRYLLLAASGEGWAAPKSWLSAPKVEAIQLPEARGANADETNPIAGVPAPGI